MFESAMSAHAGIQRILTRMTKRGVAEVMRKGNCFGQVFIKPQRSRYRTPDLRDLDTVR